MDKAPEPSPWGLLFIIAFFVFLIWHGPVEAACGAPTTDWPCLEEYGC